MMVFRTSDIILVAVMICAAAVTYKVKYDAQKRYLEVRHIERQIEAEKDTISLLRADWALLTQPARMQRLAAQYQEQLGLQVIEPEQIVKISDIPERLPDAIQNIIRDSDTLISQGFLADDADMIRTGSIKP